MQLQEIIDSISGEFGRELDHVFKEQVKTNVLIARAEAIRQSIDKYNAKPSSFVSQINCMPTETADIAECCNVTIGCDVVKTCDKVPPPIRTRNMSSDFSYVGAITGTMPFGYIAPEELEYILCDRFAKNQVFYSYINEKIYIFNKNNIKNIRVRGIFNDPFEIFDLNDCDEATGGCAETLNIPEDLITTIKSIVYSEMGGRQVNLDDEEVEVEPSNAQQQP